MSNKKKLCIGKNHGTCEHEALPGMDKCAYHANRLAMGKRIREMHKELQQYNGGLCGYCHQWFEEDSCPKCSEESDNLSQ